MCPAQLSHASPQTPTGYPKVTQSFILLRSAACGPERTRMKRVVCSLSPALRAVWSPCSVSLAHGLLHVFFCFSFFRTCHTVPRKAAPPPHTHTHHAVCNACESTSAAISSLSSSMSGADPPPRRPGPGIGTSVDSANALCGFGRHGQQCPTSPRENTHMWPFRAQVATLSDRQSAGPGRGLRSRGEVWPSPGLGGPGPGHRVCEVPREACGHQPGVAHVCPRRPAEPHPVCPGLPAGPEPKLETPVSSSLQWMAAKGLGNKGRCILT